MSGMPAVIDTTRRMVRGARELKLPIVVTEQYPKALGATVIEIKSCLPDNSPVVEKTKFSMMVPEVSLHLANLPNVKKILLVGIEAHVCIFQTAIDLIEDGYEVYLVVDGVSSHRLTDRAVALQRMSQSGVLFVTSEMALFQLLGDAKAPAFKAISALAKEVRPDPLPFPSML